MAEAVDNACRRPRKGACVHPSRLSGRLMAYRAAMRPQMQPRTNLKAHSFAILGAAMSARGLGRVKTDRRRFRPAATGGMGCKISVREATRIVGPVVQ